jgi:glycosyltransferase involved in cell wall biosynthesis
MRIAAYVRLPWTRPPLTGVGRHAVCVIRELAQLEPVILIAYRRDLTGEGLVPKVSSLAGLDVTPVPLPHHLIERIWHVFHTPPIDAFSNDPEWVYVPFECYVPSRRARVAVTIHDLHALEPDLPWSDTPEHRSFARRWQQKLKPVAKHADILLAVSDYTKSRVIELLGVSPDRVAVVGNGVDELFFQPPPSLSQRETSLHENRPYVFAGHVDDALYHTLLGRARALLFLSRYEGFGIPILEAMAMGVPVIASRFCSLPQVVGDAGLLVDATATRDIAALINDLCRSHASYEEMLARGRDRAAGASWRQCAERVRTALGAG